MKQFIITTSTFITLVGSASAQDITQTTNWLKNNTHRLDHIDCPTKELFGNHFEINEQGMNFSNKEENKSCIINWVNIKDVIRTQDYIYVVSEELYEGIPIVLKFYSKDQTNQLHFENGFKHIANTLSNKSNNNL